MPESRRGRNPFLEVRRLLATTPMLTFRDQHRGDANPVPRSVAAVILVNHHASQLHTNCVLLAGAAVEAGSPKHSRSSKSAREIRSPNNDGDFLQFLIRPSARISGNSVCARTVFCFFAARRRVGGVITRKKTDKSTNHLP